MSRDLERVYTSLFKPLKVSKRQFQTLLCATKETRNLEPKELYLEEKLSRVDSTEKISLNALFCGLTLSLSGGEGKVRQDE